MRAMWDGDKYFIIHTKTKLMTKYEGDDQVSPKKKKTLPSNFFVYKFLEFFNKVNFQLGSNAFYVFTGGDMHLY